MSGDEEMRRCVERAKASDPDAWETLYRHAYPGLHAFARRRLAGDHLADDAVSETMARAYAGIGNFTWTGRSLEAWLYGILRNVVSETHRASARRDNPAQIIDLTRRLTPPEEATIASEERDEMRAAFARLDAEERELLELRVVAGLDAEATGEIIGKRAGAVRMAQSRALDRLRSFLREDVR